MNQNFNLRRSLYGDAAIGADNLEMIQIARSNGFPAKFCGSGGAIVGMFQTNEQFEFLQRCYREKGFECIKVVVDVPEEYF
jgi:glucuronokinase